MSYHKYTPRNVEMLDKYLAEVRDLPTISNNHAVQLLRDYHSSGDVNIRNHVVESFLRYAISVAKCYQTNGFELCDLIEEANTGLVLAAEHFDPNRNTPFIIYATFWMRKMLSKFVRRYHNALTHSNRSNDFVLVVSMDAPYHPDEADDYCLADTLADEFNDDCAYDYEHLQNVVNHALSTLSDTERTILSHFYGFCGNPETDEAISLQMNLKSAEHVRQIREMALRKLAFRIDQSQFN